MYKLLLIVAAVSCSDLVQGPEGGRKIYDEDKEASPAIWKQINRVTVIANDTEVISRIVVKDLRPDKDGEAIIVAGGQGQKNVTIELKSPTILRGYSFHIDVYATEDNQAYPDLPEEPIPPTGQVPYTITDKLYPEDVTFNDTHENHGAERHDGSEIIKNDQTPVIATEAYETTTLSQESTTGAPTTSKDRKIRHVFYDQPTSTDTATTRRSHKDHKGNGVTEKSEVTTEAGIKISATHVENSTTHVENSTTHVEHSTTPVEKSTTHVEHSTSRVVSSTTPVSITPLVSSSTPEGLTASVVSSTTEPYQKAFHEISKAVGEEVIFGIKHA